MKTWFVSDHHFWHHSILKFKDDEGNFIRPGFSDVKEMNEYIIEQHNSVVAPEDKVYFLGDVVMRTTAKWFEPLERMNGNKVLIKGNHDCAKMSMYTRYFRDIRSSVHMRAVVGNKEFRKVLFTHIPIHPDSVGNQNFNVHGHLHNRLIHDPRYINVSLEHLRDYLPVSWEEIQGIIQDRLRSSIWI